MSMNFMDDAEKHLQIATNSSLHKEQLMTNLLNLAMVHMFNYQMNNGRISQTKHQEVDIFSTSMMVFRRCILGFIWVNSLFSACNDFKSNQS